MARGDRDSVAAAEGLAERQREVRRAPEDEVEIDVQWRQSGPHQWVATLTNRKSGQQLEARSERALWHALQRLRDGGAAELRHRKESDPVPAAEDAGADPR